MEVLRTQRQKRTHAGPGAGRTLEVEAPAEGVDPVGEAAQADSVVIRVAPEAGTLLIEIADDGRGGADASAGTGLRGLADRIDALGGSFDLDSPAGAGTRVRAVLPLRER